MHKITITRHIATSASIIFLISNAMAMDAQEDPTASSTRVAPTTDILEGQTTGVATTTAVEQKQPEAPAIKMKTVKIPRSWLNPLWLIGFGSYTAQVPDTEEATPPKQTATPVTPAVDGQGQQSVSADASQGQPVVSEDDAKQVPPPVSAAEAPQPVVQEAPKSDLTQSVFGGFERLGQIDDPQFKALMEAARNRYAEIVDDQKK